MILIAASGFEGWDWLVLGLYMALMLGTGLAFARFRPKGSREYFVGDRRMPVWAVALSVLATSLSAATFIGTPAESYTGDLSYFSTNIGTILALVVVATVFMPAFYRHQVTTVYQLLERRFGPGGRRAASGMFMIGRVFASGARLYAAAVPLTMILYGTLHPSPSSVIAAIGVLTLGATLYSLVGGIKSIIWTDVIQSVVFLGAGVAAVLVLLHRIPVSPGQLLSVLGEQPTPGGGSKLAVMHLTGDITKPYTLLTSIFGFSLLMTAAYGTDQDLVQRMLTCKSAVKGSQSAILAVVIGLPVVALFLAVGLLLFIFYRRPDIMGAGIDVPTTQPSFIFATFILNEMPTGLKGLMLAGVFAIALTSLMSALNAMSSTLIEDFYKPMTPGSDDGHYLAASRWGVVLWGVVLASFAALCVWWQASSGETIIAFALGVMTFAYAGLLGVYFTALLTSRGSPVSCYAALATGFIVVVLLSSPVWPLIADASRWPAWWPRHLPGSIAFPWRLLAGTVLATGVCLLGRAHPAAK